jgi:hypothetical protein
MATATSRRAPAPKLNERRHIAEERLALERKLGPSYARIAELDTELKEFATEAGASFKENFGSKGYVSASGAVAAEFKGDVPVIQTEAWLKLSEGKRKELIKSGLVVVEPQWGRASSGRVTVKVL